jgi:hypothetical protein
MPGGRQKLPSWPGTLASVAAAPDDGASACERENGMFNLAANLTISSE